MKKLQKVITPNFMGLENFKTVKPKLKGVCKI